jgi:hypothetical protein
MAGHALAVENGPDIAIEIDLPLGWGRVRPECSRAGGEQDQNSTRD